MLNDSQLIDEEKKIPDGLKEAHELNIKGISAERIMELAEAKYIPHYSIDNGVPLFIQSEVKKWIANNILERVEGRAFPDYIRLVTEGDKLTKKPPLCLSQIENLAQINAINYGTGIYFLCKNGTVVYIGQSINPAVRIYNHKKNYAFEEVFFLSVPKSELDEVESAFITYIQPEEQFKFNTKTGKKYISRPIQMTDTHAKHVIASYFYKTEKLSQTAKKLGISVRNLK